MILRLARDVGDDLKEVMVNTGAQSGVVEKFSYDAIGYFVYLRRKSPNLFSFLDSLKRAFSAIELETLRKIVEAHEGECQEDDMTNNCIGEECAPSCSDSEVMLEFSRITFQMGQCIESRYVEIMKAVSPISIDRRSSITKFTELCWKLKECGCISEYDVEFLKQLLQELNLVQPRNMLLEYEKSIPTQPPPGSHTPKNQLRRQARIDRPGPSSSSGHYGTSHSLPEHSSSEDGRSSGFYTPRSDFGDPPDVRSGRGTPNNSTSTGYFTPQSNASWYRVGSQRLAKSQSMPASRCFSRLREELGIPPTDPTYPGGMTPTMTPAASQKPLPPETPPPPHVPHPHITSHVPHLHLAPAPVSSASGPRGIEPSAPSEHILGQAASQAPGSQVLGVNVSANTHIQNISSAFRSCQNNPGSSLSPQNSASRNDLSSLQSFDSEGLEHLRPPQPVRGDNRQQASFHGNAGGHGNSTQLLHRPGQVQSGSELSSSSYNHGDENWQAPITRQNTGTRHYVCPSLHTNGTSSALQPSLRSGTNPGSAESSSTKGDSRLQPGLNNGEDSGGRPRDSPPYSTLRSSEVAGIESRSLGGYTMSESGNLVVHPNSTSEDNSGLLPSGSSTSRLYPLLPTAAGAVSDVKRKRGLPPEVVMAAVKKIKVEDHVSPNTDLEEEFTTPPSTPPERAKS